MKPIISLTILVGVLIAVVIAGPPSPEEKKKLFDECKDQEKASEEDVESIMNHKIPQGPNAKCFLACVHEKAGLVKDGKVNEEAFKKPPMKDMENGGPPRPSREILNECTTITNPDRCELSFKLAECMKKAWTGNGGEMKKN